MSKHKTSDNEHGELHIYAHGKLRGDKVKYKYGESCTIWYPLEDTKNIEDEDSGICFDFQAEDTNDLISLLEEMKDNPADIFLYNEEEERRRVDWEQKQETLIEKLKSAFEDIGIHFTPFCWRLTNIFITKPAVLPNKKEHVYSLCSGVYLGPVCITWGREWDDLPKKVAGAKHLTNILITLSKIPMLDKIIKIIVGLVSKKRNKRSY